MAKDVPCNIAEKMSLLFLGAGRPKNLEYIAKRIPLIALK